MKVQFDEARFIAAGLVWTKADGEIRVMIPGQTHVTIATISDDGEIDLATERSGTHRALSTALGL